MYQQVAMQRKKSYFKFTNKLEQHRNTAYSQRMGQKTLAANCDEQRQTGRNSDRIARTAYHYTIRCQARNIWNFSLSTAQYSSPIFLLLVEKNLSGDSDIVKEKAFFFSVIQPCKFLKVILFCRISVGTYHFETDFYTDLMILSLIR